MKRKVSKIGPATLMVSLPSKWVKEYGIKKGDELDIEELSNSLVIKTRKGLVIETKTINITGLEEMVIWRCLDAIYKSGTEEIKIIFDYEKLKNFQDRKNITTLDYIRIITDRLIGMEIISQGKNSCIIREISKIKEEEFDIVLRRIFMTIEGMFNDSLEAIKKHDKELLNNLSKNIDSPLNKLINYCLRYLNKGDYNIKKTTTLYYALNELEEIGDSIPFILKTTSKMNKPLKKEIIDLLNDLNNLFNYMHKTFYTFNIENFSEIYKIRKDIKNKIENYKNLSEEEIKILSSIKITTNSIIEIISTKLITS